MTLPLVHIDSRVMPRAIQKETIVGEATHTGFGVVGMEAPTNATTGHLVVATTFTGHRNALTFEHVADPSSVYAEPSPDGRDMIGIGLSSIPVTTRADGHSFDHAAFEITVNLANQSLERHARERRWQATLLVARSDLPLTEDELRRIANQEVEWTDWHRTLLVNSIRAVTAAGPAPHPLDATALDHYATGIAGLLLGSAVGRPRRRSTHQDSRERAERFIRSSITDPDLGPETIAGYLHISTRQLSRIFSDGPSVRATILNSRLDHADRLLRDPAYAAYTIAGIAAFSGFASPAHFARAYKAHTGLTPRSARR